MTRHLQCHRCRIHFSLLNTVSLSRREAIAAEVNCDNIRSGVGGPKGLGHFVNGNVWFASVHCPEREATLLQLRFWIVPFLFGNRVAETWEEAHLTEQVTMSKTFVDVQTTKECFEKISPIFRLHFGLGIAAHSVQGHAQIITDQRLGAVVHQRTS